MNASQAVDWRRTCPSASGRGAGLRGHPGRFGPPPRRAQRGRLAGRRTARRRPGPTTPNESLATVHPHSHSPLATHHSPLATHENHFPGNRRLRRVERAADRAAREGLNVVYGPNEAGKTTLLQFIRSVLYGFSPERRRYLPPVHGGPAGRADRGLRPHRPASRSTATTSPSGRPARSTLVITAADGTRQGEHMHLVLLSNLDEAIFNNVFAVGLREIQELGTLGDTEAAELLYNITAGLDRVSLVEVMRELESLRNRILDRARRGLPDRRVAGRPRASSGRRSRSFSRSAAATRGWPLSGPTWTATWRGWRKSKDRTEQQVRRDRAGRWPPRPLGPACGLGRRAGRAGPAAAACRPTPWQRLDAIKARDCRSTPQRRRASSIAGGRNCGGRRRAWRSASALARQAARIEALLEQEPWIDTSRQPARRDGTGDRPTAVAAWPPSSSGWGWARRPTRRPCRWFRPGRRAGCGCPPARCAAGRRQWSEARRAEAAAGKRAAALDAPTRGGPRRPAGNAICPRAAERAGTLWPNSAAASRSTSGSNRLNRCHEERAKSRAGCWPTPECCPWRSWVAWAGCSSWGSCCLSWASSSRPR